jgi:hypothetical protein
MIFNTKTIGAIFFAVAVLLGCGGGGDDVTTAKAEISSAETSSDDPVKELDQTEKLEPRAASIPTLTCYGDIDGPVNNCFRSSSLNGQSAYNWKFVSGSGFWNGSAKYTQRIASDQNAATWEFLVPLAGDVWFSVWIPSTNATAKSVSYKVTCYTNPSETGRYEHNYFAKSVNQLNYSAQWVTLGNIGHFSAGARCSVIADKLDQGPGFLSANALASKMAVDGMKMAIY